MQGFITKISSHIVTTMSFRCYLQNFIIGNNGIVSNTFYQTVKLVLLTVTRS